MNPAPLCRFCGKAIAKRTANVHVRARPYDPRYDQDSSIWSRTVNVEKLPMTKDECRKLTNQHVLSVRRDKSMEWDEFQMKEVETDHGIDFFTEWDGESYVDPFFCNGDHARRFGYMLLNNKKYAGLCSIDYLIAIEKQKRAT